MIVFPMAGLSRRFVEKGYDRPKYMLPLAGWTCFDYAVAGFLEAFGSETFLFVVRDVSGGFAFVEQRVRALGIPRHAIVVLERPTSGQGETVELGLNEIGGADEPLTVFNIDTFRPGSVPTARDVPGDGYLEVFVGSGRGWSFVDPDPDQPGRVIRTTEKDPISDLCCTGLYHFATGLDFIAGLKAERRNPTCNLQETYIAPIYNHLIGSGRDIRYKIVARADVVFCGVPAEYEALRADPIPVAALSRQIAERSQDVTS